MIAQGLWNFFSHRRSPPTQPLLLDDAKVFPPLAHDAAAEALLTRVAPDVAAAFAECVDQLNRFVTPRCLRRYQSDILSIGALTVSSPFSGAPISATRSTLLPGGAVAYEFVAEERFWLLADNLAQGFPLSRILLETGAAESALASEGGLGRQAMTPELSRLLMAPGVLATADLPQARSAALVLGHPNFAHHLWNELGGIDAWLVGTSGAGVSSVTIFAQYEPLGPIEQLFGILADADIRRGAAAAAAEINRFPGLLTRIGSTVIPTSVRQRAVAVSAALSGERANAVLSSLGNAEPVFWLTIRPDGNLRSCVNELAFLDSLSCSLMAAYPDCAILIDGFSLPCDFYLSKRYDPLRPGFTQRLESCAVFFRELCRLIELYVGTARQGRVHDVCGFSLADAVKTAGRVDYYVSHVGTLQHKLAWIHNTPGFVHSCQGGISPAARKWYAAQVEGGIEPDTIASRFIEDMPIPAGKVVTTRNMDYQITDIPGAVAQILRDIYLRLPVVPDDRSSNPPALQR